MPEHPVLQTLRDIEELRHERQLLQVLIRHLGLLLDDTLDGKTLPYGVPKEIGSRLRARLEAIINSMELDEELALTRLHPTPTKGKSQGKLQGKPQRSASSTR